MGVEIERNDAVGVVTLNRPEARNALSRPMIADLAAALETLERDAAVASIVLTGREVFCAGADIADMHGIDLATALAEDFSGCCDRLASCTKPLIAAVEAYAIGGGCELIEMCDLVIAGAGARFGHPEIALGTLSGGGGTQRLARAVGRARAMDLVLTGRLISAAEAERIGLISRVVEDGTARAAACEAAAQIAAHPIHAVRFAKQAVDRAVSVGLADGLALERRLFHLSFAVGELEPRLAQFLARRGSAR
ncbi:short chain enoyl-CoA hydratase [Rhodopseudomonas thermotolerans]|uniref:Short chain enoyl-CoA hydratase n=2 Tax=Rhodopseudomonas TaxID=1073 RepID=A0A336K0K9_9BRAD|nr:MULTISPECIES: enoyl-CoA hydratase-related protein [Rhodopseudomonas]RED31851.1 short chain enoyl-CoA hydratase [Rhodopseudomonas pentothenatexigens]REF93152.1 short chain enoyl-CoA hydratase [Rhodopseudomonas thermotolerans]SSW91831.1 short chain enoyl-CoA hydratase [Rhodopseudomonas pentothenatexigens]